MVTSSAVGRRFVVAAVSLALVAVGGACANDDGGGASVTESSDAPVEQSTTESEPATDSDLPAESPATDAPDTTDTDGDVPATTAGAPTTDALTTTAEPAATTSVNVYWGWTVHNPAAGGPERIAAGERDVAADDAIRQSVEALLVGVDPIEGEIGMLSSIPVGTEVLGITVDGTTATVDLSTEFEEPGGTLDESMRLAQVVFTLTQFDEIDRVRFQVAGEPRESILSHGVEVGDGLTRDDFADVRATIMVEQPGPGVEVANPLVIRGESNTFEATVRYAVTVRGGDGVLLTEGFTTAAGGNGTWGGFEIEIDLTDLDDVAPDDISGPGAVILWEDDPRTGERVDIVEIPIVLPTP